jgi:hypothetical protein
MSDIQDKVASLGERSARAEQRLDGHDKDEEALGKKFEKYVTHTEFLPVKLLVYGFAAAMLMGVIAALLRTVIK